MEHGTGEDHKKKSKANQGAIPIEEADSFSGNPVRNRKVAWSIARALGLLISLMLFFSGRTPLNHPV